jgi:hypothetical protein
MVPLLPLQRKHIESNPIFFGVILFGGSLILFIYAVTSGSVEGWSSAAVVSTLVLSVVSMAVFFLWENKIDERDAALCVKFLIQPEPMFDSDARQAFEALASSQFWFTCRTWASSIRLVGPRFCILSFVPTLAPNSYSDSRNIVFLIYSSLWQGLFGWSAVSTSVHFIPIGLLSFITSFFGPSLLRLAPARWVLLCSVSLIAISTILLPFADRAGWYWPLVFPSFCIGTVGATITFNYANIVIFQGTPSNSAGTVGAVFNAAIQLGGAISISAFIALQTSVDSSSDLKGGNGYQGCAAGWWYIFSLQVVAALCVGVFYKPQVKIPKETEGERTVEK